MLYQYAMDIIQLVMVRQLYLKIKRIQYQAKKVGNKAKNSSWSQTLRTGPVRFLVWSVILDQSSNFSAQDQVLCALFVIGP